MNIMLVDIKVVQNSLLVGVHSDLKSSLYNLLNIIIKIQLCSDIN